MISNQELFNIAEAERRRLEDGGFTKSLKELQMAAREYAGEHNEQTEIAVFHVLENVNDRETNRRLWDRSYHLFNAIGHNREIHKIEQEYQKFHQGSNTGNLGQTLDEMKNKQQNTE